MKENKAMQNLPPYLFARIEQKIAEAKEKGIDIINLGIGDPDQPTPTHIIDRMAKSIYDTPNHQYPTSVGLLEFRQAVTNWYQKRFGVTLDPKNEVVSLLGSKEGIAIFPPLIWTRVISTWCPIRAIRYTELVPCWPVGSST